MQECVNNNMRPLQSSKNAVIPVKRGKGIFSVYWLISGILFFCTTGAAFPGETPFKNVIIMVADGMGSAHTTVSRWYKGSHLALDDMHPGAVRTYSAESLITDSAPAATAFATGHKTNDKFISVLPGTVTIPGAAKIPDELRFKPVATVLEGAKLSGRSVGIIATSSIQHATPAAFSAHWADRADYNEIAKQQVYLNMDVVLGGGKKYLLPKEKAGTRIDGEDLTAILKSRGYAIVESREALHNVKSGRLWGMFADDDMAYELDRRKFFPEQPTLSEMTQKAIELLSKNPKGFFLFVEGSKVDWASHANDPVGVISDVLAFDEAVKVALAFSRKNKQTLLLVFSDHGNGGMSIGNKATDGAYSKLSYEAVFAPLKKAQLTGEGIGMVISKDTSDGNIIKIMSEYYGIDDLTQEDVKSIKEAAPKRMNRITGAIISRKANIGWTTHGHTGEDLFIYTYGLKKGIGTIDNTDIARITAKGMGFDLAAVDRKLFVDAEAAFRKIGAKTRITHIDSSNPMLIVERQGKYAELPLSKDIIKMRTDKKEYRMEGITILSPLTKKVFVPLDAISLFSGTLN